MHADVLENKIGYEFQNGALLSEALTHPSLAYESKRPTFDNQRLEFLGDAVLQLILTDELYGHFPDFSEGPLTKLRSRLVSRAALKRYAESIELGEHLDLGRGEEASGGRKRPSNLADAFEALLGAIYLDSNYETVRDVMLSNFAHFIQEITDQPEEVNPKGQLQEKLQALSQNGPSYRIVSQEGPDHKKHFVAEVIWKGQTLGNGEGTSKKVAEIAAAADAIKNERWIETEAVNNP